MTNQLAVLNGAIKYEFRMQIRRRALWIAIFLIILLQLCLYMRSNALSQIIAYDLQDTLPHIIANFTAMFHLLLPAVFGCMMADRLPRDRRIHVEEMFTSMPGALSARLMGKYIGSLLATMIPLLILYTLGTGYIVYLTGNLIAIPLALAAFASAVLPGLLFIGAFSIACPAIIWVPLYQFLYVGYWFWGNFLSPHNGIPTLSDTILTPAGQFILAGFFNFGRGYYQATVLTGIESMLLLIGIAILVMVVLWQGLKWYQARQ
jgi:hypothetical protein